MRNTFFTSDTHFGHANIIRYSNRPQLQSTDAVVDAQGRSQWASRKIAETRVAEMDNQLINNWNKNVGIHDEVWHLGDFCFGTAAQAISYLSNLNFGKMYFVWGNHDLPMWDIFDYIKTERAKIPAFIQDKVVFVGNYIEERINGHSITMCHYPMLRWNKSHHFSWMLHGHVHGTIKETLPDGDPKTMGLILDVGVDVHSMSPISFDSLRAIMLRKQKFIEEHTPRGRHHETL